MKTKFGPDQIVYQLVSNAGGYDGTEKDPGGKIQFASFSREEAERKKNNWQTLKLVALSGEEIATIHKTACAKLDGLERLLLGVQ